MPDRTGHVGNQLGRPKFSSGQLQADMMMMMKGMLNRRKSL